MNTPFNYQRVLLIFSWIGFSASVILINSYVNPAYNNDTITLSLTIGCLLNSCYLFTSLIGINAKVRKKDDALFSIKFRTKYKSEIDSWARQIKYEQSLTLTVETTREYEGSKGYLDKLEHAKTTWKGKRKEDLNPFEKHHCLDHAALLLNKTNEAMFLLLSLILGVSILNLTTLTLGIIFRFSTWLIVIFMIYIRIQYILLKMNKLREETYPPSST